MDKSDPKANLKALPAPAPNSEPVSASNKTADVVRLSKRRWKDEVPSAEIFARRLPELEALAAAEVLRVNVRVPRIVMTVLGALPKLNALRGQIEATFRVFDFKQFDGLEEYVFTLNYTHALVKGAERLPRCPPGLQKEALALQRSLLSDCRALEVRGLITGNRLRHFQKGYGYQIWASNLVILASVLTDCWPNIAGRCATTAVNLKRAGEVANQLLTIGGRREKQPENIAHAKDLRARAFTLLTRAYREAQLAALYLLKTEEKLQAVAPRLANDRKRRRRSTDDSLPAGES